MVLLPKKKNVCFMCGLHNTITLSIISANFFPLFWWLTDNQQNFNLIQKIIRFFFCCYRIFNVNKKKTLKIQTNMEIGICIFQWQFNHRLLVKYKKILWKTVNWKMSYEFPIFSIQLWVKMRKLEHSCWIGVFVFQLINLNCWRKNYNKKKKTLCYSNNLSNTWLMLKNYNTFCWIWINMLDIL